MSEVKALDNQRSIENEKQDNYDYTVGLIRVILTFLVVIGHAQMVTTGFYGLIEMNHAYINTVGGSVNDLIYSFHMITFMILTGYLYFKYDYYKKDAKTIVIKKIGRLVIPYYLAFILKDMLLDKLSIQTLINATVGQDGEHLWYLRTAFMCMMFFVVIKQLKVQNKQTIIIMGLLYCVHQYEQILAAFGYGWFCILNPVWLVCFYIGSLINKYSDKLDRVILQKKQLTLLFLSWYLLGMIGDCPVGDTKNFSNSYYLITGLMGGILLYNAVNWYKSKLNNHKKQIIKKIDKYTYSMYIWTNMIVIAQSKFVYDHHIDISGIGATIAFIIINSVGAIMIQVLLKRMKDGLVKTAIRK